MPWKFWVQFPAPLPDFMGLFDTYNGIQLKVGSPWQKTYNIGDPVEIQDGVYLALDGIVVIVNGKLAATFKELRSKYGGKLTLNWDFLDSELFSTLFLESDE